jgi:hypothetical protein
MSRPTSLAMARLLLHEDTRCLICGIPQRVVKRLWYRGGGWLQGPPKQNKHLTCDHIDPAGGSEEQNLRPLCNGCNWKKREGQLTDEEVLQWAVDRWQFLEPRPRRLYWLNTRFEDGQAVGGRPFRSRRAEQIERSMRGEG